MLELARTAVIEGASAGHSRQEDTGMEAPERGTRSTSQIEQALSSTPSEMHIRAVP